MPATFLFSFDCEGKWGVADGLLLATHQGLSDERLRQAYRQLVALLERYEMPATFAFVGLFAEPPAQVVRMRESLDRMASLSPDYLAPALADMREGSRQGWHGDWAIDLVGSSASPHEIAFHGVTHIPWDRMDGRLLDEEMSLFRSLASPVRGSRTMVFPRNRAGHLDAVRTLGIEGYRKGLNRARLVNLLDEINPLPRLQADDALDEGPVAIPAGYFVNWQAGPRRAIPRSLSRLRARLLIDRAARSGTTVHFWLHPENIAQSPRTLARLEDILALVRRACERGQGRIQTQLGYCLDRRRDSVEQAPAGEQPLPSRSAQA